IKIKFAVTIGSVAINKNAMFMILFLIIGIGLLSLSVCTMTNAQASSALLPEVAVTEILLLHKWGFVW
ncbi:MAG: hypothetical protein ACJ71R_10970, partial [Nitrososphaeraceae archaeon]